MTLAQKAFAVACEVGGNSIFIRQPLIQDEQIGEWNGHYDGDTKRAIVFKDGSVLAWNSNQPCYYPDGRGFFVTDVETLYAEICTRKTA